MFLGVNKMATKNKSTQLRHFPLSTAYSLPLPLQTSIASVINLNQL